MGTEAKFSDNQRCFFCDASLLTTGACSNVNCAVPLNATTQPDMTPSERNKATAYAVDLAVKARQVGEQAREPEQIAAKYFPEICYTNIAGQTIREKVVEAIADAHCREAEQRELQSKTELLTPERLQEIARLYADDEILQLLITHIQALTEQRRWIRIQVITEILNNWNEANIRGIGLSHLLIVSEWIELQRESAAKGI